MVAVILILAIENLNADEAAREPLFANKINVIIV